MKKIRVCRHMIIKTNVARPLIGKTEDCKDDKLLRAIFPFYCDIEGLENVDTDSFNIQTNKKNIYTLFISSNNLIRIYFKKRYLLPFDLFIKKNLDAGTSKSKINY